VFYNGDSLIEERNSSGSAVPRYSQGLKIDEPLTMSRSSTTSFYKADGPGSVTSLTSGAGALAQTYTFASFGKLGNSTGSLTNPFQYTARESDTETGLYYYRARYYDPATGRFISEDPLEVNGGLDFYSYVQNGPLDYSDPKGLFTERNDIVQHRTLGIQNVCGAGTGGACTAIKAALVICNCESECGGWKAKAELRIYGDMYIYSGIWSALPHKPKDKSVVDAKTAIAHEYNVHINPAIAAVTPLINNLEAKTFKSESECHAECDKTSGAVNKLFFQTLKATQEKENKQ